MKRSAKLTPLVEGVDYAEPCVYATKLRTFAPNETWDRWCIRHHHWLNDAPANSVTDELVADASRRLAKGGK